MKNARLIQGGILRRLGWYFIGTLPQLILFGNFSMGLFTGEKRLQDLILPMEGCNMITHLTNWRWNEMRHARLEEGKCWNSYFTSQRSRKYMCYMMI